MEKIKPKDKMSSNLLPLMTRNHGGQKPKAPTNMYKNWR